MKAAVYSRYGGPQVVQIADLPTPVPRQNEVLIRVLASTVSSGDLISEQPQQPSTAARRTVARRPVR